jgi:oxygen-dependent protoporphyrinogen oxidase
VHCGRPVRFLDAGRHRRHAVVLRTGDRIEADTVVLAVPAVQAARLLARLSPDLAATLGDIMYTSLRVIGLGFPDTAFPARPSGFGFLSPPGEGLDVIGATVSSNAFPEQAPPRRILLRAFAGGVFAPGVVDLPTDDAVRLAVRNLHRVYGVRGEPEFVQDAVWRQAIPQYCRTHLTTVERIERASAALPGVHLIGNSYRGVGLDDTIRTAARLGRALGGADPAERQGQK